MSVALKNVSKVYGSQFAVDDISFSVSAGEVLGFLGPNGAGKSTTMKMITGYLNPSAGNIEVCGLSPQENALETKAKIGYLPEHNPLYKDMYIREYLLFMARVHKLSNPAHRIQELIDMTGLGPEQHKQIGQLSKGYRQRVGLAQAMLQDPEVLILDEPTTGLDPNQLVGIRQLIKELGKSKTLLFSTHIMQEVQAVCDRVIIINQGKLVADKTIDQLTASLSGQDTVLVTFLPQSSGKLPDTLHLREVHGVTEARDLGHGKWECLAAPGTDIRPALFHFAVAKGLVIVEMNRVQQSLEQVFQQLTKKN